MIVLSAGCGPSTVRITGRVVWDKEIVSDDRPVGQVHVVFMPDEEEARNSFPAGVSAYKGEYRYLVPALPPGRYRVGVELLDSKDRDLLKGGYSVHDSPLVYDLNSDQEIDIDIPKISPKSP